MSKVSFHFEAGGRQHDDPNSGHSQPPNPRPHKLSPENVRRITDSVAPPTSPVLDSRYERASVPDSKVESLAAAGSYRHRE